MAIHDSTALVGFFGSVAVYEKTAGQWSQSQVLLPGDPTPDSFFGRAVSVFGDVAVVGAPPGSGGTPPAAYVFERAQGLWTQTAKLETTPGPGCSQFGASVAVHGSMVLIGDPGFGGSCKGGLGTAYIFERVGQDWLQTAQLSLPGNVDWLGTSAALQSGVAVLGGPGSATGRAVVFRESNTGSWLSEATLLPSEGLSGDFFGTSVDVDGDRIVVGAPGNDALGESSGAAYVFQRVNGAWTEEAKLVGQGFGTSIFYVFSGASVTLEGSTIGVGTPDFLGGLGSVVVFERDGAFWQQTAFLESSNPLAGSFGESLSLSEGLFLIGGGNSATVFGKTDGSPLFGCPPAISLAQGGTQELALDGSLPLQLYFLLGSASGTSPGIPLGGGMTLPLNPDGYYVLSAQYPNTPLFTGSLGVLDFGGSASASVNLPPGLDGSLAGLTLHHAYVVLTLPQPAIVFTSNAAPLTLVQ